LAVLSCASQARATSVSTLRRRWLPMQDTVTSVLSSHRAERWGAGAPGCEVPGSPFDCLRHQSHRHRRADGGSEQGTTVTPPPPTTTMEGPGCPRPPWGRPALTGRSRRAAPYAASCRAGAPRPLIPGDNYPDAGGVLVEAAGLKHHGIDCRGAIGVHDELAHGGCIGKVAVWVAEVQRTRNGDRCADRDCG